MYTNGIDPQTLATMKTLAGVAFVSKYYLAGGTALALYLGHRVSYDLDFFSQSPASPEEIRNQLVKDNQLEIFQNDQGTFNGILAATKLSFFVYPYSLIEPLAQFENVKVASLADITCMKLEALASRGVKRDFIDMYFLLQDRSLQSALDLFQKKYAQQNISLSHILKSLVYFEDADPEPMPNMLVPADWETIKTFFRTEVKDLFKQLV